MPVSAADVNSPQLVPTATPVGVSDDVSTVQLNGALVMNGHEDRPAFRYFLLWCHFWASTSLEAIDAIGQWHLSVLPCVHSRCMQGLA